MPEKNTLPLKDRIPTFAGWHVLRKGALPRVPATVDQDFPQTMFMIIKGLSVMSGFQERRQVIEIKQVKFSLSPSQAKKRGLNLKVSLQKLLKKNKLKFS